MIRRLLAAAALAGASALAPPPALASPCGGSSSGESSSDDSDDSSDSSLGSGDSAPACIDTTEIVGRAECSRFGSWDASWLPRLQMGAGTSFHTFAIARHHFSGTADHGELGAVAFAVRGEEMAGQPVAAAGTFDLRVTGMVGGALYLGAEGSAGGFSAPGWQPEVREHHTLTPGGGGILLAGGAVAGAQVLAGGFALRGELFLGYRALGLEVESQHLECVVRTVAWDGAPLVQTRVALSRWLTPWVSAGAAVGTSPFERGDLSAGLFLQGHLRAYDAARPR